MEESDRIELHNRLKQLFPNLPIIYRSDAYRLEYPCIVYDKTGHRGSYSANLPYVVGTTFEVSILSVTPGFKDTKRMLQIENSQFIRSYTHDDIVHDVYEIHVHSIT